MKFLGIHRIMIVSSLLLSFSCNRRYSFILYQDQKGIIQTETDLVIVNSSEIDTLIWNHPMKITPHYRLNETQQWIDDYNNPELIAGAWLNREDSIMVGRRSFNLKSESKYTTHTVYFLFGNYRFWQITTIKKEYFQTSR